MKNIRHYPIRRCVSCGQRLPKSSMIRVVSTPSGSIEIDLKGKKAGRGSYLCTQVDCWGDATTKTRLDYSLKKTLTGDQRESLKEYFRAQIQGIGASENL